MLAAKFGSHPAVIGFDLLNEPFPGKDGGTVFSRLVKSALKTALTDSRIRIKSSGNSVVKEPVVKKLLDRFGGDVLFDITKPAEDIIEKFDRERYSPFINKVSAAIRKECKDKIIFIENCYYSNLGIAFSAPPVSVNGKREKNQAFAPHAYDFMVDSLIYKYANNDRVGAIFNRRRLEQTKSLKMPVIVGEWGGGYERNDEWISHAEFLLDLFDEYKWSNTYWAFTGFKEKDTLLAGLSRRRAAVRKTRDGVRSLLCHAYPAAVCGAITHMRYDREENSFLLCFEQDREYTVPTEIFYPCAPASVECSGEYELKRRYYYTYTLIAHTKPGSNRVFIKF